MSKNHDQWQRREGYGGPESFPEDGLAQFSVGETQALHGREISLYLEDGRVIEYRFDDEHRVSAQLTQGGRGTVVDGCTYWATECAPNTFFFRHGVTDEPRLTTCVAINFGSGVCAVIEGEIPDKGDDDFRIRIVHTRGALTKDGVVPDFPEELIGQHFVAEYSDRYAWELIYLTDKWITWRGVKGNPGIADTEEYQASAFSSDTHLVSWSEKAETMAAVFFYNFSERTVTGHMWGYAPEEDRIFHAPLGARIVPPKEFGIALRTPEDEGEGLGSSEKNIELVLRSHEEVWNNKRYDLIPELYTEDYAAHFICDLEVRGQAGVRDFICGHHQSFPDWHEVIVDVVAEGDRVVTRYNSTGTHQGVFQGLEPTGRTCTIGEVSIYRIADGKIAEQWGFPDGLSHMQQLTVAD